MTNCEVDQFLRVASDILAEVGTGYLDVNEIVSSVMEGPSVVIVVASAMTRTGKKRSHIGGQASPVAVAVTVAAVATAGKERLDIGSQTPSVARIVSFERGNRQGGL